MEDWQFATLVSIGIITLIFIISIGLIALSNYDIRKNCDAINKQGIEAKIIRPWFTDECFVKINNTFIPVENWREFGGE